MNTIAFFTAFIAFALPLTATAEGTPGGAALVISHTVKIPDGFWDYVTIDAASRELFLGREDGVMIMNLDDETVVPRFVPGQLVHSVVPLPNGQAASTNGMSNTASLFDLTNGTVRATIATGKHPDAAVYEASTGFLFVVNMMGGDVTVVDPNRAAEVARIAVGGRLEFAATDDHGKVYVNIASRSAIAVIDALTRKVVARYKLPACDEPSGLAIDPQSQVLVAACDNSKAVAVGAQDGRIIAQLATGEGADAVIFDASRKRFLIPCGGTGSIIVLEEADGAPPHVGYTLKTSVGARTGAIDAKTGNVYLPTADYSKEMMTVFNRKVPKPIPGSTRMMVLSSGPSSTL